LLSIGFMPRNNPLDPEEPKTHIGDDEEERRDTLPDPRVRAEDDEIMEERVEWRESEDEEAVEVEVEDDDVLDLDLDDLPESEGPDA
jgi:hypothetical protein